VTIQKNVKKNNANKKNPNQDQRKNPGHKPGKIKGIYVKYYISGG